MSVHVHDVFLEGRPEPLENIKDMIKSKCSIKESRKVKKFLKVNYKVCHDEKCSYGKMTMEKDVKKLVYGYDKFNGSDVKVNKKSVPPGTTLCKSKL